MGWYSDQFTRHDQRENKIYGEITPCYAVLTERSISEIGSLFPNIKLIFIARDLVNRAWSALLMELRNTTHGLEAGVFGNTDKHISKRELDRIERDSNPNNYDDNYFMDRLRHSTHSSRCDYAKALRSWLNYFPKNQLLIVNYDDLSTSPRSILNDVCDHIGVEVSSVDDSELTKRVNVGKSRESIRPSLQKKMEIYLKTYAYDFNKLLEELGYTWKIKEYC